MSGEDLMKRARGGDEEALEEVLGRVQAPVWDLSLLLAKDPAEGKGAAIAGLAALALVIRTLDEEAELPSTPLGIAAAGTLALMTDERLAPPKVPSHQAPWLECPPAERRALLASEAAGLDEMELGYALGEAGLDQRAAAKARLSHDPQGIIIRIEAEVSPHPMPADLTERALQATQTERDAPADSE